MNSKRKVAIFDIDGTIFRSSLLVEIMDALIQEGVFPASARRTYARAYKKWLERKDTYERYIAGVVRAFLKNIRGVEYRRYARVVKKVVVFHRHRVYRYTRDLIKKLKKQNYFLLAISHSPREAVEEFVRQLGFDKIYGLMFALNKTGRLTGKVLHWDLIEDKAKILRLAAEKGDFTLNQSVGVGDTEADIPFLKLVEHPVCFNPNKKLYQYARRRGWKIVVERKDVIYHHTYNAGRKISAL